ncbi:calcium/calmodulin-dependent 3' [Dinothrombium tinctorium]|uniref:Calcium/calmodulin-dependent 3 n=1 Tax=Dinothrombium tinctorium TaxID=1965070 RepID=A0A3S4R3B6_9ACAR|nr:calcium/calmodulin-dependent 3' [Dinothrombium tinctorium]RWS11058.1 calcium/calmodulin-dependent 3' [Dinothrombium tinctorium]
MHQAEKFHEKLREIAHHLDHGEVPIDVLQKTLQYAACVLDTVSMDETRKWSIAGVRKKPLPVRTPSEPSSLRIKAQPTITAQEKPLLKELSSDLRKTSLKTLSAKPWTRRLLDEEDDLSEVQPDAVPNEVREWLATTFTRNNQAQKRRSEDKPKFRSVANAIRAGIMVDRLYRRLCSSNMVQIPTNIADILKNVDEWSFEIFAFGEAANNQVLKYLSYELFNRYGLLHKFKVPQINLDNFLFQIEQGYIKYKNPYHNNLHAADVTQSVHYILCQLGLVFRSLVIDMVLATDMSSHFQQIKTMKSLLAHSGDLNVDKSKALSLGDKERELGLPYSPLCDRNTTLVPDSQIGFIDFIVGPSMEVCGDLLDKIHQTIQASRRQHSSGSSEESFDENEKELKSRPKSLSAMKSTKAVLSLDSVGDKLKSRPITSAPASPRFSRFTGFTNNIKDGRIIRPWIACLEENRTKWQERAVIDHKLREQNKVKTAGEEFKLSQSPESEL